MALWARKVPGTFEKRASDDHLSLSECVKSGDVLYGPFVSWRMSIWKVGQPKTMELCWKTRKNMNHNLNTYRTTVSTAITPFNV